MLRRVRDPIGAENDDYIVKMCGEVERVVVAWGNWGRLWERDRVVLPQLRQHHEVMCLGLTKRGCPRHPLYIKRSTDPMLLLGCFNGAAPRGSGATGVSALALYYFICFNGAAPRGSGATLSFSARLK